MTNESREELIRLEGRLMEESYAKALMQPQHAAIWRADAAIHQARMGELIAERTPEQVRCMELERGLA